MKKFLSILLVMSLLIPVSVFAQSEGGAANESEVPLVVAYLDDEEQMQELVGAGMDVTNYDPVNKEVQIVLHNFDQEYLSEQDIAYDILVEDLNEEAPRAKMNTLSSDEDYRSFEQYEQELHEIAEQYPNIAALHVIGESREGNPIYALEISDSLGETGEPESVHMALYHAREWPTGEMAMDLAHHLTDGYGENDQVTQVVDDIKTWIIPVVNPDGFIHSYEDYRMWRKNRVDNGDGTFGVDLNRNHSYLWGSDNGSSGNTDSNTYRGTDPFSEPETAALRDFFLERNVITTITSHTHGELILYPWAHKYDVVPDPEIEIMAAAMSDFNGYADIPAMGLYPQSGDYLDWMYGTMRGISFTFESATEFIPPYEGYSYPGVQTDNDAFEARLLTYSPELDGQEGLVVDSGQGIDAADFPAEVNGNIALIERGEGTFREKALNAQAAGAIGVIFYNNTSGFIEGTLGSAGVDIPAIGIERSSGLSMLSAMDDGEEITATLTAEAFQGEGMEELYERNLPAFMYSIEQAKEHGSIIDGNVTDKLTGEALEAQLEFESSFDVPLTGAWEGQTVEETQQGSLEAEGSFEWTVLPSEKPELDSDPYDITVTSPGRYEQQVEVEIDGFGQEETVDIELQPVLELKGAVTAKDSWSTSSTIPLRFATLTEEGIQENMEDVRVTIYDGDTEFASFTEGDQYNDIRQLGQDGDYHLNLFGNQIGFQGKTYDVEITFNNGNKELSYEFPLQFGRATQGFPILLP
ncbi:M14 family zinc carboxypeptidase [Virgibacillus oceani]